MGTGTNQADIVFCIDASGSMEPCIQGVKDNISTFIGAMEQEYVPGQGSGMDWRVGFIAFDNTEFRILDPTKDVARFRQALAGITVGADEIPLPALDWALDTAWRSTMVHRVIIFMTDELFRGGDMLDLQQSKFQGKNPQDTDYLMGKFLALRPVLLVIAPRCPEYEKLAQLPKAHFIPLENENFSGMDFSHIMTSIGKTVSRTMGGYVPGQQESSLPKLPKDIYGMAGRIRITKL